MLASRLAHSAPAEANHGRRNDARGPTETVHLDAYRALREGHRRDDRLVRAVHPPDAALARRGQGRQERLARRLLAAGLAVRPGAERVLRGPRSVDRKSVV